MEKNDINAPNERKIKPIAHISSDFPEKFGIPRQSGLVPSLQATVVFQPEYRNPEALRGLEEFSHIWLIWEFSESILEDWSPTVRPPRLGGNVRKGVFATRSPFRPNPIGLSCVRLEAVRWDTPQGAVLQVSGADLMDGTPIYDIKPYIPMADCHPEALGGFSDVHKDDRLQVTIPEQWKAVIPRKHLEALLGVLENDPRPAYQRDPERVYGLLFGGMEIKFTVRGEHLEVCSVEMM
ncbi:MAG: tRNA (N6-threonylcarbamoyladenosine(37)-N6)-methyltransferase TrmO [Clostridiales bacterium]|nr:tRNA (N6-threonylcarbamoyladenosine(37)-N6)-methyltransferase TrmO [Clostridiales bacterium]